MSKDNSVVAHISNYVEQIKSLESMLIDEHDESVTVDNILFSIAKTAVFVLLAQIYRQRTAHQIEIDLDEIIESLNSLPFQEHLDADQIAEDTWLKHLDSTK